MHILIRNGIIINEQFNENNNSDNKFDIIINDGIVIALTSVKETKDYADNFDYVIDANGQYIMPGLVDLHCHLREPGFTNKETIASGTLSAAAGGFTDIACMPNTKPVIDNKMMVEYLKYKIKETSCVNVYPIGAVTKGQNGEELAEIGRMAELGIVAISDDGKPVMSAGIMESAIEYASMFDIPVISHCEDLSLIRDGQMHEGFVATDLGLKGISPLAEEVIVARDIAIAKGLNIHIHLAHISTKNSVEMIRDAKYRGVKITAETCPHYFSLNCNELYGYNVYGKVNPPLREDEDIEAIIAGLVDGTLDYIATDHAPHSKEDKEIEFNKAANGISGFETAFSVAYTYLVKKGYLTLTKLLEKMSLAPAKFLKQERSYIKVGSSANITLFDPNEKWIVDSEKFLSKGHNTPFNNKELIGKITATIVNGNLVYNKNIM